MKIALITGASSGMGREFALRIAALRETDEVWLVARREQRLEELREELRSVCPARIYPLDLTDTESFGILESALDGSGARVKYLVNAAGFGKFGTCREVSAADAAGMIDLNLRALVSLCYLALPFMGHGSHIINLSSASAYLPLENMSVYAATKSAVLSFSRSLRAELAGSGISVTAVTPGWVDTEFAAVASNGGNVHAPKKLKPMTSADKVVKKALADAHAGRALSVYGATWKCLHLFSKILPSRLTMSAWSAMQKKK